MKLKTIKSKRHPKVTYGYQWIPEKQQYHIRISIGVQTFRLSYYGSKETELQWYFNMWDHALDTVISSSLEELEVEALTQYAEMHAVACECVLRDGMIINTAVEIAKTNKKLEKRIKALESERDRWKDVAHKYYKQQKHEGPSNGTR